MAADGDEMKVEKMKWITRKIVRANPDKLFLFGDNLERRGFGGQAKEMRGETNAKGIAVKSEPSRKNSAYFSDDDFDLNTLFIDNDFRLIRERNFATVVIPEDGIGTGLAELDKRAPRTFAYLQERLAELGE